MVNKFNRSNFYKLNTVNNKLERDLIMDNWDQFIITKEVMIQPIINSDIGRPDLCSIRFYGTDQYWWILSKYNNIMDWWNDVQIGMVIAIPNSEDIQDFYLRCSSAKKLYN